MPKIKVFLSYCRHDTAVVTPLFGEFKSLLKSISFNKQTYKVDYYWDAQNVPGIEWDSNIKWWLKEADVIVFFVTHHFLASGYVQAQEIPIALERMETSGVHLLPILVDNCDYQNSEIGHLQFIPVMNNRLKPYCEWKNKKEFRELARIALKLSIKNTIVGHPHHLQFHTDVLSPIERNKYAKLFLPPEVAKLSKIRSKKSTKKKIKKKNFWERLKNKIRKIF